MQYATSECPFIGALSNMELVAKRHRYWYVITYIGPVNECEWRTLRRSEVSRKGLLPVPFRAQSSSNIIYISFQSADNAVVVPTSNCSDRDSTAAFRGGELWISCNAQIVALCGSWKVLCLEISAFGFAAEIREIIACVRCVRSSSFRCAWESDAPPCHRYVWPQRITS